MKRFLSIILAFVLTLTCVPSAFAASNEANQAAQNLYKLGLFNGTGTDENGNPNFDLDRAPTRHEAVAMLVRLLGKGEEAVNGTWNIPFTDVADWAKPYVGYAYANGLTSGTSATTYSGNNTVTASEYLTFVLRALEYQSGSDFQWNKAWELSDAIGLTDGRYNAKTTEFLRGDVAIISNKSLSVPKKFICAHIYSETTTPATCTSNGNKTQVCDVCGQSTTEIILSSGHTFDNGSIISEASFSSAGEKIYTCTKCGTTKSESIPKLDISSLPKYPESTYKVGANMPAGRYILISNSNRGYFSLTSDPNGGNILCNDNFGSVAYVDVYDGTYLELSRCYATPYTKEVTFNPVNNGFVSGIYMVGKDIPAGSYKLTSISRGYYCIYDSPNGNINANDAFRKGTVYIEIKNGEFVKFRDVLVEKF